MDAKQAAERAAEKLWATGNFGLYTQEDVDDSAEIVLAEFATLLAAKDAEIERLRSALGDCFTPLPIDPSRYGVRLAYINDRAHRSLRPAE